MPEPRPPAGQAPVCLRAQAACGHDSLQDQHAEKRQTGPVLHKKVNRNGP